MPCKLAELNWKIPCFREYEKERKNIPNCIVDNNSIFSNSYMPLPPLFAKVLQRVIRLVSEIKIQKKKINRKFLYLGVISNKPGSATPVLILNAEENLLV